MGALALDRMGQEPGAAMSRIKSKEPFVKHRRSMLESPAWRMLPHLAYQLLNRIELEHMRHGGKDNGRLVVTYTDVEKYAVCQNPRAIAQAVRQAEALGFLIVTRGRGGRGASRQPNQFRLTYLEGQNGGPATDEWTEIQSEEDARARLAGVKKRRPQTGWFRATNVVGFTRKS
jgi:hypothetical protein